MSARMVLLGPPGAGKGTQAARIAERLSIPAISTGDIFRANVAGATELGTQAKAYMDKGEYVPDSITNAMVADRIAQADCKAGFLLDGYPRTTAQVGELDSMLKGSGLALDVARMRKDDSAAAHVDKPTVLVVHKRPLRSIVDERIGVEQCGGPAVKRTERQRYQLADGAGVYGRIHQIENQTLDALRPLGLWKRYEVPHVSPLLALYFAISLPAASTLRTGPSACPVIPDTPAFNGFDVVILPIVF